MPKRGSPFTSRANSRCTPECRLMALAALSKIKACAACRPARYAARPALPASGARRASLAPSQGTRAVSPKMRRSAASQVYALRADFVHQRRVLVIGSYPIGHRPGGCGNSPRRHEGHQVCGKVLPASVTIRARLSPQAAHASCPSRASWFKTLVQARPPPRDEGMAMD